VRRTALIAAVAASAAFAQQSSAPTEPDATAPDRQLNHRGIAGPETAVTGSRADLLVGSDGLSCLPPGGGVLGYETPHSSAPVRVDSDLVFRGGCWGGAVPCSTADIADPIGTLDLADITRFITDFIDGDRRCTDFAEPIGVLVLADINQFVASFLGGCP
jgi:hypothetical protein